MLNIWEYGGFYCCIFYVDAELMCGGLMLSFENFMSHILHFVVDKNIF